MINIDLLPKFKYHPNLYENDIVIFEKGKCECCGKDTEAYISSIYSRENVKCICLNCVADGSAAKKFNGEFIQDVEKLVSDKSKTDELMHRTPGYISWQGEYWLTCCDDYCEFIGDVGTKELEELGIANEVFEEFIAKNNFPEIRDYLVKKGSMAGYLFRCSHCGKYHLWADAD